MVFTICLARVMASFLPYKKWCRKQYNNVYFIKLGIEWKLFNTNFETFTLIVIYLKTVVHEVFMFFVKVILKKLKFLLVDVFKLGLEKLQLAYFTKGRTCDLSRKMISLYIKLNNLINNRKIVKPPRSNDLTLLRVNSFDR